MVKKFFYPQVAVNSVKMKNSLNIENYFELHIDTHYNYMLPALLGSWSSDILRVYSIRLTVASKQLGSLDSQASESQCSRAVSRSLHVSDS